MDKKILVTRSSMPSFEEYSEEIRELWESAWLTNMGLKHKKLQEELAKLLQTSKVSLFSNGHMALELALQAMELHGQVITTPFTFASTTHAIVRNNLTPVFCDINYKDYTLDIDKLEALITPKTVAIVPVHVYGNVCDNDAIMEIAKKHNLRVIYDAAHAFAIKKNGVSVATYGDASMFSFHATKVFNTIEGGAVASEHQWLHDKLYQLKNFGIQNEEVVDEVGANAKMNEFQAAMGLCNLRHLEEEISKRRKAVEKYRELLGGIAGIKLCATQEGVESNYAYFPVVFEEDKINTNRDAVYDKLKEHNIFARKYFYPLVNDFQCYRPVYNSAETPVARKVSERVLCLPLFADIEENEIIEICRIIKEMV